jgi:5-(aminomethyl)-3-furanmethanol phosphate kinase
MPLIVYKLGGSLLTLSHLQARLATLFEQPVPLPPQSGKNASLVRAVLVGGGEAADRVRAWDRRYHFSAETSHDLALQAMRLNGRLVNAILPHAQLVSRKAAIRKASQRGALAVLDPVTILEQAERESGERLPRSWDVTSDSIAAFLAANWEAGALVLVKSTAKPSDKNLKSAVRRGLVDAYFPRLASRIPLIAWSNLRSRRPTIERWL